MPNGTFTPATGSLLIKRTAKKTEALHGLVLPTNSHEIPCDGIIISVGLGRIRDGVRELAEWAAGDHVYYARFTDEEIVIDDETFHLVRFENVHGVLKA
jgi:co-chaperonin GroES (HSP10)